MPIDINTDPSDLEISEFERAFYHECKLLHTTLKISVKAAQTAEKMVDTRLLQCLKVLLCIEKIRDARPAEILLNIEIEALKLRLLTLYPYIFIEAGATLIDTMGPTLMAQRNYYVEQRESVRNQLREVLSPVQRTLFDSRAGDQDIETDGLIQGLYLLAHDYKNASKFLYNIIAPKPLIDLSHAAQASIVNYGDGLTKIDKNRALKLASWKESLPAWKQELLEADFDYHCPLSFQDAGQLLRVFGGPLFGSTEEKSLTLPSKSAELSTSIDSRHHRSTDSVPNEEIDQPVPSLTSSQRGINASTHADDLCPPPLKKRGAGIIEPYFKATPDAAEAGVTSRENCTGVNVGVGLQMSGIDHWIENRINKLLFAHKGRESDSIIEHGYQFTYRVDSLGGLKPQQKLIMTNTMTGVEHSARYSTGHGDDTKRFKEALGKTLTKHVKDTYSSNELENYIATNENIGRLELPHLILDEICQHKEKKDVQVCGHTYNYRTPHNGGHVPSCRDYVVHDIASDLISRTDFLLRTKKGTRHKKNDMVRRSVARETWSDIVTKNFRVDNMVFERSLNQALKDNRYNDASQLSTQFFDRYRTLQLPSLVENEVSLNTIIQSEKQRLYNDQDDLIQDKIRAQTLSIETLPSLFKLCNELTALDSKEHYLAQLNEYQNDYIQVCTKRDAIIQSNKDKRSILQFYDTKKSGFYLHSTEMLTDLLFPLTNYTARRLGYDSKAWDEKLNASKTTISNGMELLLHYNSRLAETLDINEPHMSKVLGYGRYALLSAQAIKAIALLVSPTDQKNMNNALMKRFISIMQLGLFIGSIVHKPNIKSNLLSFSPEILLQIPEIEAYLCRPDLTAHFFYIRFASGQFLHRLGESTLPSQLSVGHDYLTYHAEAISVWLQRATQALPLHYKNEFVKLISAPPSPLILFKISQLIFALTKTACLFQSDLKKYRQEKKQPSLAELIENNRLLLMAKLNTNIEVLIEENNQLKKANEKLLNGSRLRYFKPKINETSCVEKQNTIPLTTPKSNAPFSERAFFEKNRSKQSQDVSNRLKQEINDRIDRLKKAHPTPSLNRAATVNNSTY